MHRRSSETKAFELGSHEWAALPDLGLPAILAKIDTGARTSALHATDIEVYDADGAQRIRFVVHPVPGRRDLARTCDAVLAGRRWVTSSVGAREQRCLVVTQLRIGDRSWPIEVTLTDRGRMRFSMLLGRSAILPDMIVMPRTGRRQPAIGLAAYDDGTVRGDTRRRAGQGAPPLALDGFRIGLVGVGPVGPNWQMLADAATARGHVVERLDVRTCRLVRTGDGFGIESLGRLIAPLAAVIAFIDEHAPTSSSASPDMAAILAVSAQAELAGAVGLNSVSVLLRMTDPILATQAMWAAGLRAAVDRLDAARGADSRAGHAPAISGLVAHGEIVALRQAEADGHVRPRRALAMTQATAAERALIEQAAHAAGAGLARVDLLRLASGEAAVAGVDVWQPFAGFPRKVLQTCAPAIVAALERCVQGKRLG